jgi:hypothetical protein
VIALGVLTALAAIGCVDADGGAADAGCDTTIDLDCEPAAQLGPTNDGSGDADTPAGLERCDAATFNATDVVACLDEETLPACTVPAAVGGVCGTDAPCARGQCIRNIVGQCTCIDACTSDDECQGDDACVCSSAVQNAAGEWLSMTSVSTCVPIECRTGADCLSGACGVAIDGCGTPFALRCRSVADECASNADCDGGNNSAGDACVADNGSGWRCGPPPICQ